MHRIKGVLCLSALGLLCLAGGPLAAQDDDSSDALVGMIVELLGDADRDMRALGFQQVREEAIGEAATKQFTEVLPKLAPDGQAGLLEALGDRGDATALPAVLDMLKSPEETVRAAALGAVGALGSAANVPLLAQKAAEGSGLEKGSARKSLLRLRGDDVNPAILSEMAKSEPGVRAGLLGVLAARNAKETLPAVLKCTDDPEPCVRLASLGALRFLAGENDVTTIVAVLKSARNDDERSKAELALLAVCNLARQDCAETIIAGMADAEAPSRIALLRTLARAGGPKALEQIVASVNDDDQPVSDEAVRMLSAWGDPAAAAHLLQIAGKDESLRHRVLAIRGLARLAGPKKDRPADLDTLAKVMKLAKRPQEKRLLLGVLGGVAEPKSLALVTPALDDTAVKEEAGLAAVMIAERIKDGDKAALRAAMEKVLKTGKNQQTRDRAQKVLDSL